MTAQNASWASRSKMQYLQRPSPEIAGRSHWKHVSLAGDVSLAFAIG
jgi:hypothetical protein